MGRRSVLISPEYLQELKFSATFRSEAEEKFKVNLKSVPSKEQSDTSRTRREGQFLFYQARSAILLMELGGVAIFDKKVFK